MLKLGILIPTYNGASNIAQALTSLASQSLLEYGVETVLLYDDHSTDQTVETAKASWNNTLELAVIVSEKNQGLFANHNAGLKVLMAQNVDWIFIFHQDDYVKTTWLDEMVAQIKLADANVATICSSYDSFYDDGTITEGENKPGFVVIPGVSTHIRGTLLNGGWWHLSGCALNVQALIQVGIFNASLPHMGDWEWTLRCLQNGWDIQYIPRSLCGWRQHASSYSAHSMRTVFYTQQQLQVIRKYGTVLSKKEWLVWHGQQLYYALRRTGRALVVRNPQFLEAGLKTMKLLASNGIRGLW